MSLHFICLTATGGVPIFTRKRGDCDALPFSTVGSLNGVHMFCKSQGTQLNSTYLEDDTVVVWKDFENCFTMIGIGKGYTEKVIRDFLDVVFNATIFSIGLNEVKHNKNAEQLKRELKHKCYPIVDKLIENIDSDLLKLSDCIIPSGGTEILSRLNEFSEQVGSPFCCVVMSRQKIVAGTEGWWDLNVIDRKLLITILGVSNSVQVDVPVYLPKKSPNIAYRFVCIPIFQMISVCVVCGAEPNYATAMSLVQHIWRNDLELLRNAKLCYPRNFSTNLPQFDPSILGILLVNRTHSKYVMSRNLQPAVGNKRVINTGGHHRLDILRTFFHQAVDIIDSFLVEESSSVLVPQSSPCKAIESYWTLEYHKCHSYISGENLICILYTYSVKVPRMRSLMVDAMKLEIPVGTNKNTEPQIPYILSTYKSLKPSHRPIFYMSDLWRRSHFRGSLADGRLMIMRGDYTSNVEYNFIGKGYRMVKNEFKSDIVRYK